jgi:hypothetical protein
MHCSGTCHICKQYILKKPGYHLTYISKINNTNTTSRRISGMLVSLEGRVCQAQGLYETSGPSRASYQCSDHGMISRWVLLRRHGGVCGME